MVTVVYYVFICVCVGIVSSVFRFMVFFLILVSRVCSLQNTKYIYYYVSTFMSYRQELQDSVLVLGWLVGS